MDHTGSGAFVEWLLLSQVVGYTVATVIVLLLSMLVSRAARYEDPRPYVLLVGSVLLWNGSNLLAAVAVMAGIPAESVVVRAIMAAAFSGGALSPGAALVMWSHLDRRSARSGGLIAAAFGVGLVLAILMWASLVLGWPRLSIKPLWTALAYHVMVFFGLGAWMFYGGHKALPAARAAIGMAGVGAIGVGLSVALQKGPVDVAHGPALAHVDSLETAVFEVVRQISTHVMTLGALIFLARFRFADVFVRQSLRLIAAAVLGLAAAGAVVAAQSPIGARFGVHASSALLATGALVIAVLLIGFALVDRLIVALVDRWLFQQPDYETALRRLRDELSAHREREALHAVTTQAVRDTLGLRDARIMSRDDGEAAERVERIPIRASDGRGDMLDVTPRWDHPTLLAREIDFLRDAATALGERLDVVHREREEVDRRTHEAELRRQVSEATLRALQAQVNPHFLFNTLNTIAHLIQDDPAGAEAMTLRLAEVFSHVLTGGHRPFSSVREEMDFLRTYLTIEEARFGDRLRVAFAVEPRAEHVVIPSLILQPAVENALKHGLSRKIGPGHLTISAAIDGADLRLSVEDDGVGPNGSAARRPSGGVGLRNISERLRTLYADRATLRFEAAPQGGSVLTVRLPLHHHDQEPAG
jgi:two-component system, LytTR family, sensor kinase